MDARQAALPVADTLEALYGRVGVPTREELRAIAHETVKNFNANSGLRSTGGADRGRHTAA